MTSQRYPSRVSTKSDHMSTYEKRDVDDHQTVYRWCEVSILLSCHFCFCDQNNRYKSVATQIPRPIYGGYQAHIVAENVSPFPTRRPKNRWKVNIINYLKRIKYINKKYHLLVRTMHTKIFWWKVQIFRTRL